MLPAPAGRRWLACVDRELDPGAASGWVVRPGCGAVVTFTGTVRDHAEGRTGVHLLEYEAYEEQVVPALERVAAAAEQRFGGLGRIVLWHRIGPLAVSDVAVVVAVSTPHRSEAFAAASWAIDEVKATAPIWKREHHDAGVDWGRCDHAAAGDHGSRPAAAVGGSVAP